MWLQNVMSHQYANLQQQMYMFQIASLDKSCSFSTLQSWISICDLLSAFPMIVLVGNWLCRLQVAIMWLHEMATVVIANWLPSTWITIMWVRACCNDCNQGPVISLPYCMSLQMDGWQNVCSPRTICRMITKYRIPVLNEY